MIFSRLFFLYVFLIVCILVYYATKKTSYRNAVLIIASLLFYAFGEPAYLWLLLLSTLVNFVLGKGISKNADTKKGKAFLILGLVLNLGTLVGFKYTAFFIENLNHFGLNLPVPSISIPLGLSFFTFRAVSYLVDCHWQTIRAERNYFRFLLYLSFFPITVSGPIVRYETMQQDMVNRKVTAHDLNTGFTRLCIGLGKKVLLADQLSDIVTLFLGTDLTTQTTLGAWYGVLIYSLQIYFDFSGYSDMAIGLCNIFGFHPEENFRYPYAAKDVTEFWQRWHISLTSFFRDYLLYIPLFGKRRKYAGIVLVWICTGLWHGASWNFLIWGIYYCLFLLFEMGLGKKTVKKIPRVIRHIYSKIVIIVGFGIFYCTESVSQVGDLLTALFGLNGKGLTDQLLVSSVVSHIFLIGIAILCCFPWIEIPRKLMKKSPVLNLGFSITGTVIACGLLVLSSILLVNATNSPFLYTKF